MAAIRMFTVCLALAVAGAPVLSAESLALIIANQAYKDFSDAGDAFDATLASEALRAAGYEVRILRNLNRKALAKAAPGIRADIEDADRVIVFISGHVVSTARESWLLTTDAKRQDGLVAGAYGLPIHVLADMLADKAGSAVLLVGQSDPLTRLGDGLRYGYTDAEIPQGVTVFSGRSSDLARLLRDALLSPGTSIGDAAQGAPAGVAAYGFLPPRLGLVPELLVDQDDKAPVPDVPKSPTELARDAEAALGLSRAARRQIQRHLSLLGHDTRGIDGIFGLGTRAAVTSWQALSEFPTTGYLTGNQITALADAADARALELEEQSRLRQQEQDQLDAEYWRQIGRDGGEAELHAYLKRYPDGLFSDIARDRLQGFDDEDHDSAEAQAWDLATATNTEAGFDYFLGDFPDGEFADNARSRLQALKDARQNTSTIKAAQIEERQVLASPLTRLLVEQRLRALGLKPGKVDGNINDDTRKAVRRFQRSAGLPVTGYVTRTTIVRLLSAR